MVDKALAKARQFREPPQGALKGCKQNHMTGLHLRVSGSVVSKAAR